MTILVDIAVLVPPAQLTVNFQLEPTSKGLADGQGAYFVGFPYGVSITYKSFPDVNWLTVCRNESWRYGQAATPKKTNFNPNCIAWLGPTQNALQIPSGRGEKVPVCL